MISDKCKLIEKRYQEYMEKNDIINIEDTFGKNNSHYDDLLKSNYDKKLFDDINKKLNEMKERGEL